MEAKTELETAKEWWNNLSIGEQYKLTLKLNELKDFDSNILSFYQKEVLDKQLEIEQCRFIGDCKFLCLTSCLKFPNDKNISLINKGNNIQSADNDLIGKLKEAKEVIEALNSAIDLYWNNYNKPFPESEVIFAQRQCLKFLESLTTLADKQDLK